MKIDAYRKKFAKFHLEDNSQSYEEIDIKDGNIFVHLTQEEAIGLMQSLINQMVSKSPNVGRGEFYTDDNIYFSVAVEKFE